MESRRKKQYLVAGMMVLFSGMACVVPLPTRDPGTALDDAITLATDAKWVISPMPSDLSRLTATECNPCE